MLGGSGFVGKHIAHQLAAQGIFVRVLTRRRERAKELLVLPTVDVVQANVHDPAELERQFAGMDAVINLVGILHGDFLGAHVEFTRKAVNACAASAVPRLLHMSALGADPGGPSAYLRSKGVAEQLVQVAGPGLATTIFRPSVIFGPGDSFLNMFARLIRLAPVIPLACPNARFQPVFVEDVARAYVASLDEPGTFGQAYNLCGPTVYRLRELVELVAALLGKKPSVLGLSDGLSYLQAIVMEHLPGKLMTRDNYSSMKLDSVCRSGFPAVFGFQPTSLEAVAPLYLTGATPRGRYPQFRYKAGR